MFHGDVHHAARAGMIREKGNGVHPGVFEMLPNALLEANEVILAVVLGRHSGVPMVAALLHRGGRYRTQLVRGGVVELELATSPS